LHELSHIGTDSIGETEEFWENFKYLIKVADQYDAYIPVNYDQINYAFHQMEVDSNPYYIQQIADITENKNAPPSVQMPVTEHFTPGVPEMNVLPGYQYGNKFMFT
jgi:hypothetical protein